MSQSVVTPWARIQRADLRERGRRRGRDDEAAAVEERAPDLQRRGVEGERRELEEDLVGGEARVARAHDEADHGAVGTATPLGRPVEPEVYIT